MKLDNNQVYYILNNKNFESNSSKLYFYHTINNPYYNLVLILGHYILHMLTSMSKYEKEVF